MKKLLLTALALIGLAAPNRASAYDTIAVASPVSELTDGGTYYIYDAHADNGTPNEQSGSNDRYAFRKAISDDAGSQVKGTHIKPATLYSTNELDNYSVWKAYSNTDGTWKFQNVGNGLYFQSSCTLGNDDTAASFNLEPVSGKSGTFNVKVSGSETNRWDGNAGSDYLMVYWGGSGHPIQFYQAVAEDNGYKIASQGWWNVTYTYPAYNEKVITKTVSIADGDGAQYHVPAVDFFTATSIATTDPTVREGNVTFTVNGEWAFPIVGNHVYRMINKPSTASNKYLWWNGTNALNSYSDIDQTETDRALLWYFKTGETIDNEGRLSVTIHSLAMADNEGLQFGTGDNSQGVLSETPTVWYLEQSTQAQANKIDFTLRHSEVLSYINDRGSYLSTWNSSSGKYDAGSVIRVEELLESDWEHLSTGSATTAEINAAKADPTPAAIRSLFAKMTVADSEIDEVIAAGDYVINNLGFGNDDDKAAWQAAKDAVVRPMKPAAFNTLKDAYHTLVANSSLHIPAEGKHVKFRHPQQPLLMGIVGGNIQRNGNNGTTTFTLKPAEGGFNIYNEYAGAYLKHPTAINANIDLVEDATQATVYVFDRENIGMAADVTDYNFGIKSIAGSVPYLHTNSGEAQANVVMWYQGRQSSWYIELSDAETAAAEYLAGAKAHFAGLNFGNGMGEYQITPAGQVAVDNANAVGDDASIADKRAAGQSLRNVETALNMPKVGHIYAFSRIDGSRYMSCDTISDHRATMIERTDANMLSTLFYLDENNHLVALKDGTVMGRFNSGDAHGANDIDHSWRTVLLSNTDKVGVFTFGEAAGARGKYTVIAQGNRYIYNANDDVDAGGSAGGNGYFWTIEDKGVYTPIPGSDADRSTMVLPFAMNRRDDMVVYTAAVNNGKMILTEFTDDVIPANTPFMVDWHSTQKDSNNNLVFLEKANSEGNVPENNDLQGSIYAVANEGYAVRSGNHFSPATEATINGFIAYIPSNKLHMISNEPIENAIDELVGKVFAIKNTDTANNRGYLIYKDDKDVIWTSGKAGVANGAADDAAATNVNYHWTLVKDADGNRYLYNIAARKFAAAYTPNPRPIAEFSWHFSDYPTAIDFCFYDYNQSTTLETATFNIIGGETNHATRPAGMMVINGHDAPVPATAGNSADDGCGFQIKIVESATAGEVASVDDAIADMTAEHAAAKNYIASHETAHCELPGHYTAAAYEAFEAALANEAADAQAKYYQLVRAIGAANGNINEFENEQVYELEGQYATLYLMNGSQFYVDVEDADNEAAHASSNIWLCNKTEEGNVSFTHSFIINESYTQIDKPAAVRARVAAQSSSTVAVPMFAEPSAPIYKNGYGDIEVAGKSLKVTSAGGDAETTGIHEITSTADAPATAYDLQGRRVNGNAKGLVIVNGKKTLLR